ncbi:DUF975 family protein [Aerococcus urinae]|uniref:DUF975 family protein n=1 Tax=Aerococcus urinae TaxID=1376 RepID=UPI0018A74488|nr:DUF975 family protein [Aerococcus urinae]
MDKLALPNRAIRQAEKEITPKSLKFLLADFAIIVILSSAIASITDFTFARFQFSENSIDLVNTLISTLVFALLSYGMTWGLVDVAKNHTPYQALSVFQPFKKHFWHNAWTSLLAQIVNIIVIWLISFLTAFALLVFASLVFGSDDAWLIVVLVGGGLLIGLIAYWVNISLAMTPILLKEEPEMGAFQVITTSWGLMRGNRWRYFCLMLSYKWIAYLLIFISLLVSFGVIVAVDTSYGSGLNFLGLVLFFAVALFIVFVSVYYGLRSKVAAAVFYQARLEQERGIIEGQFN